MPDILTAALISLTGAAIIGPLIAMLMSWMSDRPSALSVAIRIHKQKLPRKLAEAIAEMRRGVDAEHPARTDLRGFEGYATYMDMTLVNARDESLRNVSVALTSTAFSGIYQVGDDSALAKIADGTTVAIGELGPRESKDVHFWFSGDMTDIAHLHLVKLFEVTADEIEGASFLYPVPDYLQETAGKSKRVVLIGIGIFVVIFGALMLWRRV